MTNLIIGGSGFIGSHLVDALLARGEAVRVYDRAPERFRPTPKGVDFRQGDFSDTPNLAEALTGVTRVFHLLSTTVPATSNLDPVNDIQTNLINTVRLLELLRKTNVNQLVYLSSGGTVYGIPDCDTVPETHPLRPISSYGIVKVAVENYLHMEHHLHGLNYTALRVSNPYGPRQGHGGVQGVIGTYLWKIAHDEPIELWGDGSIIRDFIYAGDLADQCLAVVDYGLQGCVNAGSGEGHSIQDILTAISKVTGRPAEPIMKPGRGFDVPRIVLDMTRLRQQLDWDPRVSLDEGIARTWEWVLSQKGQPT